MELSQIMVEIGKSNSFNSKLVNLLQNLQSKRFNSISPSDNKTLLGHLVNLTCQNKNFLHYS